MKPDLNSVLLVLGFTFIWWSRRREIRQVRDALGNMLRKLDDKETKP